MSSIVHKRQRVRSRQSRVECLDHHLCLASVGYQQVAAVENHLHRLNDAVEAAGSPSLLCEADDAQWLTLAVLDDRHYFGGKRNLFEIEVCFKVSNQGYQPNPGQTHSS